MNDDRSPTDEELRLVTSRTLPAGTALDAEATALREGFLTLGSALEASGEPFDETTLVTRLHQSCLDKKTRATDETQINTDSVHESSVAIRGSASAARQLDHHRTWQLVLGAALAVAAMVAIARITTQLPSENAVISVPESARDLAQAKSGVSRVAALSFWNDSLDDEIALAAVNLEQLAGRSRGFDGSLWQMNERLEALSQELSAESL